MTYKMVTDSEKAVIRIAGTALAHSQLITRQQTEKWRHQMPEGQDVVDIEQIQRFHAEELRRLREELRQAERDHLEHLKAIRKARKRRDAAVPALRTVLYSLRDLFKGVYGEPGPSALFTGKPVIPVDATPLRRIGRIAVSNLRDADLELPEPVLQGNRISRRTLARQVEEPLNELEAVMEDLEGRLLPLASRTLAAKHAAHAAVDEKSAALARYLEGLYELAGFDELATRVRPSSHRSKQEDAETAAGEQGAGDEDAREATEAVPGPAAPRPAAPRPEPPRPEPPRPEPPRPEPPAPRPVELPEATARPASSGARGQGSTLAPGS